MRVTDVIIEKYNNLTFEVLAHATVVLDDEVALPGCILKAEKRQLVFELPKRRGADVICVSTSLLGEMREKTINAYFREHFYKTVSAKTPTGPATPQLPAVTTWIDGFGKICIPAALCTQKGKVTLCLGNDTHEAEILNAPEYVQLPYRWIRQPVSIHTTFVLSRFEEFIMLILPQPLCEECGRNSVGSEVELFRGKLICKYCRITNSNSLNAI